MSHNISFIPKYIVSSSVDMNVEDAGPADQGQGTEQKEYPEEMMTTSTPVTAERSGNGTLIYTFQCINSKKRKWTP